MSNLLLAVAEQFKGGVPTTMSGPLGIFICTWHTVEAPYSHDPMTTARYLRSKGADTHLVFNPITGVVVQMLDGNQGARTLRDDDWPLDPTNTWGQRHIQIEVMGYAERPWTNDLTPAGRATLRHIMEWLRGLGVPDRWCNGVRPPVYPGPGVRKIQPTESGHFHHAGWVDNNHGDPGAIADPWVAVEGETVATPLLKYPARANLGTAQFWRDIEKVIRSEGFEIYCGRSFYDDGRCRPGKHGHGVGSLHFEGLALDFGRDYATPISPREKIYVSAKIKMLRDYYGSQMGWVHDRGTNDHEDHGHVQARPNITNGKLWDNTLAGVTMYGDRNQAVTDWQASLKRAGEDISVDGSYRLQTFWATRRWQSRSGLTVDGIIGGGSRAEMERQLTVPDPKPEPKPVPEPQPEPKPEPKPEPEPTTVKTIRITGSNRYATAAEFALHAWPNGAGAVYLVEGYESTPDANVAAGGKDGPVLYVSATGLPRQTAEAIAVLKPTTIVGVGDRVTQTTLDEAARVAGLNR